jgi:hypothetical protein
VAQDHVQWRTSSLEHWRTHIVYKISTEKRYCVTNVGDIYTACVNEGDGVRVGQSV